MRSDMTAQRPSCFIIGEGSLVVQCSQALLDRDFDILGIVSSERAVLDWATAQGLRTAPPSGDLTEWMGESEFDYLFSIVNLRMLPAEMIERPRVMGINFHDGPLPKYAGINAPSWALLEGAKEYGVTWHEMTAEADRGRVLEQSRFEIGANESAFSLNARCFNEGMESFSKLADKLVDGTLQPAEQDFSQRSYFGKHRRPVGAGLIDFSLRSELVRAFVAAHDYGNGYANPFGLAKVKVGDRVIAAQAAVQLDQAPSTPGTVESVGDDGLVVSTVDSAVRLEGLRCMLGTTLSAQKLTEWGFVAGASVDAGAADALTSLNDTAVRKEAAWTRTLSSLSSAELPAGLDAGDTAEVHQVSVSVAHDAKETIERFALFLGRLNGCAPVDVRFSSDALDEAAVGVEAFVHSHVPLRVVVTPDASVGEARERVSGAIDRCHIRGPYLRDLFLRVPDLGGLRRDTDGAQLSVAVRLGAPQELAAGTKLDISVDGNTLTLRAPDNALTEAALQDLLSQFGAFNGALKDPNARVGGVSLLTDKQRKLVLETWNDTHSAIDLQATITTEFEARVAATPDAPALSFRGTTLTYAEADVRANRLARHLRANGVRPDGLVGVFMERSNEMVVAALAIMKAGGAYVPLDPEYPADRLAFMIEDSRVAAIVTQERVRSSIPATDAAVISVDGDGAAIDKHDAAPLTKHAEPSNLAYVIYTSGSTGRPKGVMVEHRNAVNFFVGMDDRLDYDGTPGTWLAVTSLNFDISVLELFWSLTRGFHVLVQADDHQAGGFKPEYPEKPIEFGAFYFSSDESEKGLNNKYQLLLEGARFADRNGFTSVWTPERHFHAFGGLYPNPSVTSAALSTITENVRLQSGSCVSPLHSPIRIAEEWSVVDNLSNGRVGLSFAAGWQPNDFVIRPQNFENRREQMLEDIETVRALWRGESRKFEDGTGNEVDVKTLPRPVQPELPVWITAAGNPATFEAAGKQGCNLLTHLLGQSVEELKEKVAIYRKAYAESGAPGRGVVSLMLHTYVGVNDEVSKETVREPMKSYLKSAVGLVKAAAWSFPTFKKTTTMEDGTFGIDHLGDEEMDALLEHAFERYYKGSGLFGSVQSCVEIVDRIKAADIDEIPCLIDFGIPTPQALEALPRLAEVLRRANQFVGVDKEDTDFSIAALTKRYGATHFQCTPSQMTMLMVDPETRDALSGMKKVMVGGEALAAPLARELEELVEGDVLNMYGPTETTIWSSTSPVKNIGESVSIGTPIANTQIVILDQANELLPPGAVGELCIGGTGVVRGYLRRPELTAERFIGDPNGPEGARLYRTGDRARFRPDGTLEFHGRLDHQVKLRGYRIELGEIEARLSEHPSVRAAAVLVREDTPGDKRLVGYMTRATAADPDFDLLKAHLRRRLPDYMVPSLFVVMDRFPETPNRKTDRKALPAPEAQASASASFVEPESQLEQTISEIWCEVLALPRVGANDNFFDIGGHSLLTIQMHGRLNQTLDRKVSLVDLFRYPTVKSLARYLDGDDGKAELKKTKERAAGRKAAMAKRRAARGGRRG